MRTTDVLGREVVLSLYRSLLADMGGVDRFDGTRHHEPTSPQTQGLKIGLLVGAIPGLLALRDEANASEIRALSRKELFEDAGLALIDVVEAFLHIKASSGELVESDWGSLRRGAQAFRDATSRPS